MCMHRVSQGAAVCGSVWQCVAVHHSASQCIAVHCSVLQCAAVRGSVLLCAAVCCSALQRVAVRCNVLQCDAVWRSPYPQSLHILSMRVGVEVETLQDSASHCNTLQHTVVSLQHSTDLGGNDGDFWCYSALRCAAVCCSVLQCAAVCCSVLQCAAMCCE